MGNKLESEWYKLLGWPRYQVVRERYCQQLVDRILGIQQIHQWNSVIKKQALSIKKMNEAAHMTNDKNTSPCPF